MGEEVEKLVERLKAYCSFDEWGVVRHWICDEAAATLERVARENAELRAADRDHLAATRGMEKRLFDQICELQSDLQDCHRALDNFGIPTRDDLNNPDGAPLLSVCGRIMFATERMVAAEARLGAASVKAQCCGASASRTDGYCLYQQRACAEAEESSARVDLGAIRPGDEVLIRARVDTREGPLFSPIQHVALNVGGSLFTAKASLIVAHIPAPTEARSEQAEGEK
jgi:hypothetical protein